MRIRKNALIEVFWDDIISDSTWSEEKKAQIRAAARCQTVGYFLNQDKKVLRLSDTLGKDGKETERSLTVIPHGVITKIRRLK